MVCKAIWIFLILWAPTAFTSASNNAHSLPCDIGMLLLRTQQDVNNFAKNNKSCNQILGELIIIGPNITNLDSLHNIQSITGSVSILYCDSLKNLKGLSGLKKITGPFIISNNALLKSLSGLDSLREIAGELTIANSPVLESLTGLDQLDHLPLISISIHDVPNLSLCGTQWICNFINAGNSGSTFFKNNAPGCSDYFQVVISCTPGADCPIGALNFYSKQDLDQFKLLFPKCKNLEGSIWIQNIFEDSADLDGLSNLESVSENIVIFENENIINLKGLKSLRTIGGFLIISSNPNLISLDGVDLIRHSKGILLKNNPLLSNLESLHTMDSCDEINVIGCTSLNLCNSNYICSFLRSGGKGFFSNNAKACSNKFQIYKFCEPTSICPSDNIIIQSMEELNAFKTLFPDCINIQGSLTISPFDDNYPILSVVPLNHLRTISGAMEVKNTTSLIDLKGLDSIAAIHGGIHILQNAGLKSLFGLIAVREVKGDLYLSGNESLVTILDLNPANTASITHLNISNNSSLSVCNSNLVCTYLSSGKPAFITNNRSGCLSLEYVQSNCKAIDCKKSSVVLNRQSQVDKFPLFYSGCTSIANITIRGNDITNLDSLHQINTIYENLTITNNPLLKNITGLANLTTIGGIINLHDNPMLSDVQELKMVAAKKGDFILSNNKMVKSMNLTNSISVFQSNPIQSTLLSNTIKNYSLDTPITTYPEHLHVFPNPTSGFISIRNTDRLPITRVEIKDMMGRTIKYISTDFGQTIDLSHQVSGIYVISISTPTQQWTRKVYKQ